MTTRRPFPSVALDTSCTGCGAPISRGPDKATALKRTFKRVLGASRGVLGNLGERLLEAIVWFAIGVLDHKAPLRSGLAENPPTRSMLVGARHRRNDAIERCERS